jgi:hypothetical protein
VTVGGRAAYPSPSTWTPPESPDRHRIVTLPARDRPLPPVSSIADSRARNLHTRTNSAMNSNIPAHSLAIPINHSQPTPPPPLLDNPLPASIELHSNGLVSPDPAMRPHTTHSDHMLPKLQFASTGPAEATTRDSLSHLLLAMVTALHIMSRLLDILSVVPTVRSEMSRDSDSASRLG